MSSFGQPVYEEPSAAAPGQEAPQAPAIDPNDPALTSESLTDNTEKDAFVAPPPAPDGKWNAKLRLVDIKDRDGSMKPFIIASFPAMNQGKPFYAVNIEASIIDHTGSYDGTKLTEYWIKSNIDRSGTSQMTTITKVAGGTPVAQGSQQDRLAALQKALAGEPQVVVETSWEAQCQTCQQAAEKRGDKAPKPFLRGMHRFPPTKVAGVYQHEAQCPVCRSVCRAQVRIAQFFKVGEVKATRGV